MEKYYFFEKILIFLALIKNIDIIIIVSKYYSNEISLLVMILIKFFATIKKNIGDLGKEKRAEISRLQRARKFQQVKEMNVSLDSKWKRSKGKRDVTSARNWAKECPNKGFANRLAGSKPSAPAPSGAAAVESVQVQFIAAVQSRLTLADQLRSHVEKGRLEQEADSTLRSSWFHHRALECWTQGVAAPLLVLILWSNSNHYGLLKA